MKDSGQIKDRGANNSCCFFNIPPKQFSLLSSILGILLIDGLDVNQQNALGNFLVNIGQNIMTAAAQEQVIEEGSNQGDDLTCQIELLKKHICILENQNKKK